MDTKRRDSEKIRYELDPHNRLILNDAGDKSGLHKFRKVLDGQFKTDEFNNLSYHVKAPLSEDENIPHQVKLKGEWSLTDDHRLRLTLDKWGRQTFGDQLTLEGEILDVDKNSILFAVTTTTKEDTQSTYVLNLGGSWKADEFNRLSFHVKKEEGRYDILTFNGIWEVNKNHQVIYRYEEARLVRKKRKVHTLTFKGYWDIKEKLRISYVLSKDSDSLFEFKTGAGRFSEGWIQYEVGVALTGRPKAATRAVTLYGSWSLKKDTGLIFEIEYENKEIRAMVFNAQARLTDRSTVIFSLKNDLEARDIGVTLELSCEMLKGDGEAFLRLLKSRHELAVYAGAAWRW